MWLIHCVLCYCVKVVICSTSLPHCESEGILTAETSLPDSVSKINIARTFVTQSESNLPDDDVLMLVVMVYICLAGCILLGVGYHGGLVKVYSLTVHLQWSNQFSITASLATELHDFRGTGEWSHGVGWVGGVSYGMG